MGSRYHFSFEEVVDHVPLLHPVAPRYASARRKQSAATRAVPRAHGEMTNGEAFVNIFVLGRVWCGVYL